MKRNNHIRWLLPVLIMLFDAVGIVFVVLSILRDTIGIPDGKRFLTAGLFCVAVGSIISTILIIKKYTGNKQFNL